MALEILSKVYAATGFGEPESGVSPLASDVVQRGIRREFPATLRRRPPLGSCDERGTDYLTAGLWNHVPALEVGNAIGAAGIDDVPDREFCETDRTGVIVEREKDFGRFPAIAGQKALGVTLVLSDSTGRPQRVPQLYPIVTVSRLY